MTWTTQEILVLATVLVGGGVALVCYAAAMRRVDWNRFPRAERLTHLALLAGIGIGELALGGWWLALTLRSGS